MSLIKLFLKLHPDRNSFIDIIGDLRTISAATLVVGGVARFFGFHNPHHVNRCGMGFLDLLHIIS